jgi:hypothetical protein
MNNKLIHLLVLYREYTVCLLLSNEYPLYLVSILIRLDTALDGPCRHLV